MARPLGCSGVLGFVAFLIVALDVMVPAVIIVRDDSAWVTWGAIIGSVLLGWQVEIRLDRAARSQLEGRIRHDR